MSDIQGDLDADSLAARLQELGERSSAALDTIEHVTTYMEATLERGLDTAQVRMFFDFCTAEPELALMLALIGVGFGLRADAQILENFEGSGADFAPLDGSR